MQVTLAPQTIETLVRGECADVFSTLGMHPLDDGWVVRAFLPDADERKSRGARTGKARVFQRPKSMPTGCLRHGLLAAARPSRTI